MTRRLYTLLLWLLLPLSILAGWRRCRRIRRRGLAQPGCLTSRWGSVPDTWRPDGIWFHAVSMGETRSVLPLLKKLHQRYPALPLTLTYGSPNGLELSLQFSGAPLQRAPIPYDYPFAVRRFLRKLRPRLVVMVETEIWPNLYAECRRQNIPLLIINARLKTASFQRYRRWGRALVRRALQQVAGICCQFPVDVERFQALGAPPERIRLCGNLKFDLVPAPDIATKAQRFRQLPGVRQRFVWCAGSTHAGEEKLLLNAHRKLRRQAPDALLILVPRHAERFDEVARLTERQSFSLARHSLGQHPQTDTAVLLGDTTGELMFWYAVCDVAFVGGSLVPFGGHNILEPASLQRPVLSGPHCQNLKALYQTMAACGGVHFVQDVDALAQSLVHYAQRPERRQADGKRSERCFRRQQGALEKHLTFIERFLA